MTPRTLFTARTTTFGVLLIIGLSIFVYRTYFFTEVIPKQNDQPSTFTWRYEKATTLNLDGIPNTDIFLEMTYPNGEVRRMLIDTTPGSCNDLPDTDADSVPNSTTIQCYSAGLGYRYKVTKGEHSYIVQRKTFEEALPDNNPPAYEYEVIREFPFYK